MAQSEAGRAPRDVDTDGVDWNSINLEPTRIRSHSSFPGDPSSYFRPAADGRTVFFLADDGEHGVELWKSDGTVSGTRMVKDVCPGACSGAESLGRSVGGLFFYSAQDETRGLEPWSSDGSAAGTQRIADLCPGTCSSGPQFSSAALGSRLPFLTGMNGAVQTWATDGSATGTIQIGRPAEGLDFAFLPFDAPPVGSVLLGMGKDREHGLELWRSDLTRRGTRLVADLNVTDRGGSHPFGLKMVGATAYFFADDGLSGFELWKSDGTARGTVQVVDAVPGPEPLGKPGFDRILGADSQGRVYFLALTSPPQVYALWRTDGSVAGTFPLTDPGDLVCRSAELAELGGRSYFALSDADHGCELWSSDGTVAGTKVVDAIPGPSGLDPKGLVLDQGKLFFRGFDPDHGDELWPSDGTVAGTVLVADAAPGGGFGIESDPVPLGGRIYFIASDGASPSTLWSSDGTEAGTRAVFPCSLAEGCRAIDRLYKAGNRLWLNRTSEPGGESTLLASDGTAAGTVLLAEATIFPASPPSPFQGKLYFSAINRTRATQLWVSDGTAAGTRPFHGRRGAVVVAPDSFVQLGERLLFLASPQQSNARLLWQTDGTQAGTSVIPGVAPTGTLGQPLPASSLAGTPERLFLSAADDASGVELWGMTP